MQLRAYLVSGEFRVHRDGCRDCQREARRSDSPGHPEEYASQADVIASLWSDIIAENPELYSTPGGIASLEEATIFLPCTRELPRQPGAEEKVAAWAAELGLEAGDLHDLVHAAYSKLATEVNNSGLGSQIRSWSSPTAQGAPCPCSAAACGQRQQAGPPQPAQPGLRPARSSARRRPPAGSACRPACCQAGPPASAAGGPACFHAGGRVKPTTGDSPPFDAGSP
jgi:hypothetical protein